MRVSVLPERVLVELVESLADSMCRIDSLNRASVDTSTDEASLLLLNLLDDCNDVVDRFAAINLMKLSDKLGNFNAYFCR